jgi:hypothetical protein
MANMYYLHYLLDLSTHDVIQVTLNRAAYIRVMDDENYTLYRQAKHYKYFGGLAEGSPANLKPPYPGHWHLCVDLGGKEGELDAVVHIVQEIEPVRARKKGHKR